jgi:hypothetical protein
MAIGGVNEVLLVPVNAGLMAPRAAEQTNQSARFFAQLSVTIEQRPSHL